MLVNSAFKMLFKAAPKLLFKPRYSEIYAAGFNRYFCTVRPPGTTTTEDVKRSQIKVEGTKINVELNGNAFSYEGDFNPDPFYSHFENT